MDGISQLMAERQHTTFNLEKALQEVADLRVKSVDATKKLRKALLQAGFTELTIPYGVDPGYVSNRNTEYLKALIEGTQAGSLVNEVVKEHATIKARIGKGGIA